MYKLLFNHPRLWISIALGLIAYWLLPASWPVMSRILVGWNCGVSLFLALVIFWMTRLTAAQICSRYVEEDESAPIILIAIVVAALLSLIAIVEPLTTLKHAVGAARAAHFALAALTLVNSWVLVPIMFTTHYANLFYSAEENGRPLLFPKTSMPIFWDFAYFSFTIAAACQTSDVSTANADIRKIVIAHTVISFLFNASILGFAINVTAGLVGAN